MMKDWYEVLWMDEEYGKAAEELAETLLQMNLSNREYLRLKTCIERKENELIRILTNNNS